MNKISTYITGLLIAMLGVTSCDVHEFPEPAPEHIPFTIHLNFDKGMQIPLYKEVYYDLTRTFTYTRTWGVDANYDVRYIIKAYKAGVNGEFTREADTTFVYTRPYTNDLNFSTTVELPQGNYKFLVWTDYIDAYSVEDKFYKTDDYAYIELANLEDHAGNCDYRDAFRGEEQGRVFHSKLYQEGDNTVTVEMERPMAKFKFISTDYEGFIDIAMRHKIDKISRGEEKAPEGTRLEINPEDYRVIFRYNGFMANAFNMFTNKPAWAVGGVWFDSTISLLNDKEADLGFDYVFVNGKESTVEVSVEVYDDSGDMLAATTPVVVPIVRSKMTIVRGEFLTSKASGGVGISPGFDGDINVEIK